MTDIIDTNVLIGVFTRESREQAERAYRYIEEIQSGQRRAFIPEAVLLETVQVLSSKTLYAVPRPEIRRLLDVILDLRGVTMSNKAAYRRALELYSVTNLDFTDVLNIAYVEVGEWTHVVSFDQGYDRVASGIRWEPR